jgi:hypothetical protein
MNVRFVRFKIAKTLDADLMVYEWLEILQQLVSSNSKFLEIVKENFISGRQCNNENKSFPK